MGVGAGGNRDSEKLEGVECEPLTFSAEDAGVVWKAGMGIPTLCVFPSGSGGGAGLGSFLMGFQLLTFEDVLVRKEE